MQYQLDYIKRLVGTGLGFLVFGVGGVMMAIGLLPAVLLLRRRPEDRYRLGRRSIQLAFRGFLRLLKCFGVANIQWHGFEQLKGRQGMLVVANHPTLIDVVCLIAKIDNADCVVKRSLRYNPATLGPIRAAGFIPNTGGDKLVEDCVERLRNGSNLIIFPEGTRTVPGQPMKLKRGAANIALAAATEFTPVRVSCTPLALSKNQPWYNIPERKFDLSLEVLPDMETTSRNNGARARAARNLTQDLHAVLTGDIH